MFVNYQGFQNLLAGYRLCWISGRFGGHKTSFAFAASEHFLKRGYRLVTNVKSVWADKAQNVGLNDDGKLKTVIILDEGGQYMAVNKQVQMMMSYAAKMDMILLIPSYFPPPRAAQVITVQATWSLKHVSIPCVFYRASVRLGGFNDRFNFAWLFPGSIYGVYSRLDPSSEGAEILEWAIDRANQFRKYHGRGRLGDDTVSDMGTEAEVYGDAGEAFAEAAANLETVFGRIRRGRRI